MRLNAETIRASSLNSGIFYVSKVVSNGNFGLQLHWAGSSDLFPFRSEYLSQDTTELLGIS